MALFHKIKILICSVACIVGCSTNELPPCGGSDCVDSCVGNFDCEPGLTCQSFQNGEVNICAEPPKEPSNNGVQTNNGETTPKNQTTKNNTIQTNNGTVQTNNGTGTTNNGTVATNNGTTTAPLVSYTHFLLRDQTVGRGCTAISNAGPDPGSDIMWISFLNGNGQTLGYATAVTADDGAPDNGHDNPNILNGAAPATNGVGCTTAFNPTTVYSMGCNGTLVFSFSQNVTEGLHTVVVGEYGSTCSGSADDSYQLFACTDPLGARAGNLSSCNIQIGGNGEGIASFPLP